jgi:hypothetical protein
MQWGRRWSLRLVEAFQSRRGLALFWLTVLGGGILKFKWSHAWYQQEIDRVRRDIIRLEGELAAITGAHSQPAVVERVLAETSSFEEPVEPARSPQASTDTAAQAGPPSKAITDSNGQGDAPYSFS